MKCLLTECTNNITVQPHVGRPGKYCSDACKQKNYRLNLGTVTKLTSNGVTKFPAIQFYCGLNEKYWNHHIVKPGTHVCIAPITSTKSINSITGKNERKRVKTQVLLDDKEIKYVLLDSGAFSDGIELYEGKIITNNRLSFERALYRQVAHAYEFCYPHLVEAIVSYDLLIDEVWQEGERSKQRWSKETAEFAVNETIQAAQFLALQRERINNIFGHPVKLVLSAQGVEAEQYARCTSEIVKCMKPDDIFGLGGWCISGLKRHTMLPAAKTILPPVFKILGDNNVSRVHVFGVIFPALLGYLLYLSDLHSIHLSTDSAGPATEPVRNGNWGYGSWTDPKYKKPSVLDSCKVLDETGNKAPVCDSLTRCSGLERIRHVTLTREYLASFREREPHLITSL